MVWSEGAMSTTDAEYRKLKINEELRVDAVKKVIFRDNALYISSKNDGHLDLDADVQIDMNAIVEMGGYGLHSAILKYCQVGTVTKATPVEGDMRWDGTNHKLQVYNGSAWETVTSS